MKGWFNRNDIETSEDFLKHTEDFLQKGMTSKGWGIKIGNVIEINRYVAFLRMEPLTGLLLCESCS